MKLCTTPTRIRPRHAGGLASLTTALLVALGPLPAQADQRPNQDQGVFGPDSRSYQGPDYDLLRPEDRWRGQPGWGPGGDPRYWGPGPGAPYYGGYYGPGYPNYGGGYDPRYDQRWQGRYGPDQQRPLPRSDIFGPQSEQYGGPDYSRLRPQAQDRGQAGQSPSQDAGTDTQVGPDTSIYGEESRKYGGPDYSNLRPDVDR